ncbi:hypothetical protein LPJ78_000770 [Coemansia sp. RSA 989]|nr:NUDIX hydrolase domain-like protein [Coemansia mojavensis]KAJ1743957.1 hypothetical protein LPJ68_000493 [Coemansia sp. RSA 1086]KAJ1753354.1 hypothetical protein LPJ79_000441 [Coemansia sp. RSA 1821]KAJ1867718.1 hypothetical protein LPJ78_000770 [Coemansia sp. RSA 989]KAJ1875683.1 hypothetical protein LPJ55_000495 [Coemansia sp. RSA 990]KAJ2626905.1 hypothetical protein H4R22_004632 [Coemansia sp. RSA 1290]KAJ2650708.1 hypothetical protein IWW40_002216 [Coemansia sp. RSA 1250]KAJ2673879.
MTIVDIDQTASVFLDSLKTGSNSAYDRLVIGAAIHQNGSVLVVQRAAHERSFPNQWEIPGGGVDPGETIKEAVIREVREETGLDVTQITGQFASFEYLTSKYQEGQSDDVDVKQLSVRSLQLNFCVTVQPGQTVKLAPEEHQAYSWCTLQNIDEYQMTSEMKTVVSNALAAIK